MAKALAKAMAKALAKALTKAACLKGIRRIYHGLWGMGYFFLREALGRDSDISHGSLGDGSRRLP